jgi:hypothetical protein
LCPIATKNLCSAASEPWANSRREQPQQILAGRAVAVTRRPC